MFVQFWLDSDDGVFFPVSATPAPDQSGWWFGRKYKLFRTVFLIFHFSTQWASKCHYKIIVKMLTNVGVCTSHLWDHCQVLALLLQKGSTPTEHTQNYFSTVYIGKVVLDIYMKFSTGSVTLISQDNLSNKKKKQGQGSVVRRPWAGW